MKHKVASGIFLLTAISVGLGAFGHAHQWAKHVLPALGNVDLSLVRLLALVWYWVSGAMLVFGCLLVWSWWRIRQGERALLILPWIVGAFYLVEGIYGALGLGAFFLLFVLQAVLLWGSTWVLGRPTVTTVSPAGTQHGSPLV
ncbi:MAG TPA: hypothetical protein VKB72_08615 [Steroidobacteraceae bacterium]|nr:hypothetical protein [Steroidobacteraceae bacterium]